MKVGRSGRGREERRMSEIINVQLYLSTKCEDAFMKKPLKEGKKSDVENSFIYFFKRHLFNVFIYMI